MPSTQPGTVRVRRDQIIDEAPGQRPYESPVLEGPRLSGPVSDGTGFKTRWPPSPGRRQRCLHAILPPDCPRLLAGAPRPGQPSDGYQVTCEITP